MPTISLAITLNNRRSPLFLLLALLCWLGSGCGPSTEPTAASGELAPTRTPFPTYTPTTVTAQPAALATGTIAPTAGLTAIAVAILVPTLTTTQPLNTAVSTSTIQSIDSTSSQTDIPLDVPTEPELTVAGDAVNLRSGPDVAYPLLAVATRDQQFPITGRNAVGDWWQFCCVAEQQAWIYGPLVTVANAESVAVVTDIPTPPTATSVPTVAPTTEQIAAATSEPAEPTPAASTLIPGVPGSHSGTTGNFDPTAQYQIVHYRVLGFDDNNGGIFHKGGQQFIFLTVLDQNSTPVDGAVVKDAVGDKLNVVTGSKGPGKAEIKMDWDPYKLYVASDPGGPVTSQISNQMNNPHPHRPDVVGLLGPVDNEYAVCPTIDDRCDPPFFTVHFSYEITFQRVQ